MREAFVNANSITEVIRCSIAHISSQEASRSPTDSHTQNSSGFELRIGCLFNTFKKLCVHQPTQPQAGEEGQSGNSASAIMLLVKPHPAACIGKAFTVG